MTDFPRDENTELYHSHASFTHDTEKFDASNLSIHDLSLASRFRNRGYTPRPDEWPA